jgi:hypothetical protein
VGRAAVDPPRLDGPGLQAELTTEISEHRTFPALIRLSCIRYQMLSLADLHARTCTQIFEYRY